MGRVDDVQDHLQSESIVDGATGWPSVRRLEYEPTDNDDDRLVIISEDGGTPPEIAAASGIGDSALGDGGVQVRVRGPKHDSDASRSKAQEILDELHGQLGATIGSTTYHRVRAQTDEPVFAGWDDDERPSHTISFLLLEDV